MKDYSEILSAYTESMRAIRRDYDTANAILRGLVEATATDEHQGLPPSPNDEAIERIDRDLTQLEREIAERSAIYDSYSALHELKDVFIDYKPGSVYDTTPGNRYVIPEEHLWNSFFVLPDSSKSVKGDIIGIIRNDLILEPGAEYSVDVSIDNQRVILTTCSGIHFYHNGHRWVSFSNNGDSYVKVGITESRKGFVRTTKDRIEQFFKARPGERTSWLTDIPNTHAISGIMTSSNPDILSSDNSVIFAAPNSTIYEDSLDARSELGNGRVDVVGTIIENEDVDDGDFNIPLIMDISANRKRLEFNGLDSSGFEMSDTANFSTDISHSTQLNISDMVLSRIHGSTGYPRNCWVLDRNIQNGVKGRARISPIVADSTGDIVLNFTGVDATNAHFFRRNVDRSDVTIWPSAIHSGVSKQADDFVYKMDMSDTNKVYKKYSELTYDFIDVDTIQTSDAYSIGTLNVGITSDNKLVVIHDKDREGDQLVETELSHTLTYPCNIDSKVTVFAGDGGYVVIILNANNQLDLYKLDFIPSKLNLKYLNTLRDTGVITNITDITTSTTNGYETLVISSATEGIAVHRLHVRDTEVYITNAEEAYLPYIPFLHILRRGIRSFIVAPYNNHITSTVVPDTRTDAATVFELAGKSSKVQVVAEAVRTGIPSFNTQLSPPNILT